jgi:hypothetical protein
MTPDERWKEISDAFAQYMDKANDERFLPSRIAGSLDIALPQYLALRDDALRFYHFWPSQHDAQYDKYEKSEYPFNAPIRLREGVYCFGMSVQVERQPNAFPKMRVKWPMYVDVNKMTVEVGAGLIKVKLDPDRFDVGPICEGIHRGLIECLRFEGRETAVGFLTDIFDR